MMVSTGPEGPAAIEVRGATVTITGTLQLQTVRAYERLFVPLAELIDKTTSDDTSAEGVVFDFRGVAFMNSSAVTALARLVLHAKARGVPLTLVGSREHRWQRATFGTLGRLADNVVVELS